MPLSHAILAFLDYQPMSGYDLKKIFDLSIAHFWSATQSHIYKELEALEKNGFASGEVIPQAGKPNRKEYSITDEGRAELRRWLTTSLAVEPVRQANLIQIFFSHFSSNDEIIALLDDRMVQLRERIQTLRTQAQSAIDENAKNIGIERARQLWQITLDYGIEYHEFELAWHEKTKETIRGLSPLIPPG